MNHDGDQIRAQMIELLPRLRRFCSALSSTVDEGDDLAQATIERALARIHQWQCDSRLESWMYRIAQNLWIDQQRQKKRRGIHVEYDELRSISSEDGREVSETQLMLRQAQQAMQSLPTEQREVAVLVLIEGMSYGEAAEQLKIPQGTVMSRLSRARKVLQQQLAPQDEKE